MLRKPENGKGRCESLPLYICVCIWFLVANYLFLKGIFLFPPPSNAIFPPPSTNPPTSVPLLLPSLPEQRWNQHFDLLEGGIKSENVVRQEITGNMSWPKWPLSLSIFFHPSTHPTPTPSNSVSPRKDQVRDHDESRGEEPSLSLEKSNSPGPPKRLWETWVSL